MNFFFERFIGLRYLGSKRKEVFVSILTVISILGVAISVMVLDAALAIMTGFELELQDKLVSSQAHILVRRYGGSLSDWPSLVKKIEEIPEAKSVFPYTYHQAMVSMRGQAQGVLVRGVANTSGAKEKLAEIVKPSSSIDTLFSPAAVEIYRPDGETDEVQLPPILVGKSLAEKFGLYPGAVISMLGSQVSAGPFGLSPRVGRFVVVGIYSSGLTEFESSLVYTSMESGQKFFSEGEQVSGVEVSVSDVFHAPEIAQKVLAYLGGDRSGYHVVDWTVPNKPLWDALQMEKTVYYVVLLLLILVASFSIVSTMVMIVMEKSADIAVLKVMGATDRSVLSIFLFQGLVIGSLGTGLGTLLGYVFCVLFRLYGFPIDPKVFSLETVPVRIDSMNFILVAISGFVITSLAGIYPAFRASRIRPAEVLRFG